MTIQNGWKWCKQIVSNRLVLTFVLLCLLTGDWILFANCAPAFFTGPTQCPNKAWPKETIELPSQFPGKTSTLIDSHVVNGLTDSGEIFGFGMSFNMNQLKSQGYLFSIKNDSIHWFSGENAFIPIATGRSNSLLGGMVPNGQISSADRILGELYYPIENCVPGKWLTGLNDSFQPFDFPAGQSCLALGVMNDSLTWGACREANVIDFNLVTTVVWNQGKISPEWTASFRDKTLISVKGSWALSRQSSGSNSTQPQHLFIGQWNTPRVEWKELSKIPIPYSVALRSDGQIAMQAWSPEKGKTLRMILDSNQVDQTLPQLDSLSESFGYIPSNFISTGKGNQWIFQGGTGELIEISETGKLLVKRTPFKNVEFHNLFINATFSVAIINTTDASCNRVFGIYPMNDLLP